MIKFNFLTVLTVRVVNCIKISLKISKRQFISWLIFSIIFMILLDRIVCEMNEFVIKIFHIKLLRCSSQITILIPISFLISIDTCQNDICSDIKLSFLVKERHNVLLDDMGSRSTQFVYFLLLYYFFYLLYALNYLDSCTSVCVLSRFNQPCISFFRSKTMFKLLIFIFFLLFFNKL